MEETNRSNISDLIDQKNGLKAWPTGEGYCQIALDFISYYSDLVSILDTGNFSKKLETTVKTWSLTGCACSAVWFHFEGRVLSTVSCFPFGNQ